MNPCRSVDGSQKVYSYVSLPRFSGGVLLADNFILFLNIRREQFLEGSHLRDLGGPTTSGTDDSIQTLHRFCKTTKM